MPDRWLFCDLDGTLVDSLPALRRVYDRFLAGFDRAGSDTEFAALNGPSLPEIIAHLATAHGLPGSHDELLARYRDLLAEAYATVVPYAGIDALFDAAQDCGLALVTAAPRAVAEACVAAHGWSFAVIVGGDEAARGKPAPDLYLLALARAGAAPAMVRVIEDSPRGLDAAAAAGLTAWHAHGTDGDLHRIADRLRTWLDPAACPVPTEQAVAILGRGQVTARWLAGDQPIDLPEAEVTALWTQAIVGRPGLFPGRISHLVDWQADADAVRLTVRALDYRHYLAQRRTRDLGLRILAVSGLVIDHKGRILAGRRSQAVTDYPGRWETVPGGSVDAARHRADGTVDLAAQVHQELAEETGLSAHRCIPLGLCWDAGHRLFDVIFALRVGPGEARGDEHRELRFLTVDELLARKPIPLTASIIALARAHPEVSTWLEP